jgi:membrane protease YdiL (CAAX protease family)
VLARNVSQSLAYGLWLLGTFAPAIVALSLTAKNQGKQGVEALVSRVFKWQVGARWYFFAVAYIVLVKLAAAVAHRLIFAAWPHFGSELPVVMLVATLFSTPVQSGEEIGWRGYALPRLGEQMGYARASLLLGVVWAAWHLPQFFFVAADTYKQSFPIWSLQVVAASVAMAWLYVRTNGSLLLTMLMHAAINNLKDIVPSAANKPTNAFSLHASPVLYLTTLFMWLPAAYFLLRLRRPGRANPAP